MDRRQFHSVSGKTLASLIFLAYGQAYALSLSDLISFFDCIWRDGREILFKIPGAAGHRRSQARHDFVKGGNFGL